MVEMREEEGARFLHSLKKHLQQDDFALIQQRRPRRGRESESREGSAGKSRIPTRVGEQQMRGTGVCRVGRWIRLVRIQLGRILAVETWQVLRQEMRVEASWQEVLKESEAAREMTQDPLKEAARERTHPLLRKQPGGGPKHPKKAKEEGEGTKISSSNGTLKRSSWKGQRYLSCLHRHRAQEEEGGDWEKLPRQHETIAKQTSRFEQLFRKLHTKSVSADVCVSRHCLVIFIGWRSVAAVFVVSRSLLSCTRSSLLSSPFSYPVVPFTWKRRRQKEGKLEQEQRKGRWVRQQIRQQDLGEGSRIVV